MISILNLALVAALAEEPATQPIDTTAVDKVLEMIQKILDTNLVTIGGVTITIGAFIFAILKFFLPKNKVVDGQSAIIEKQEKEIELLKEEKAQNEARIATLEAKVDVITQNTPNKRVRDANTIRIEPEKPSLIDYTAGKVARRKKYKVRVKKAVEENGN